MMNKEGGHKEDIDEKEPVFDIIITDDTLNKGPLPSFKQLTGTKRLLKDVISKNTYLKQGATTNL